jgi:hypothetical protein
MGEKPQSFGIFCRRAKMERRRSLRELISRARVRGSVAKPLQPALIMDYKILLGPASTPQDFDILLMVELKNMAALDGFREKADPIARKVEGTPDQQRTTQTKRLEIREIMGTKNMREISLK